MSDQFVAEIRVFACNFAPTGWAFCDGQILSIQQNTALFSLLGTQYGGNGTTNYALPDLRGRAVMGQGSQFVMGEVDGTETVTVLGNEYPSHSHAVNVNNNGVEAGLPTGNFLNKTTP